MFQRSKASAGACIHVVDPRVLFRCRQIVTLMLAGEHSRRLPSPECIGADYGFNARTTSRPRSSFRLKPPLHEGREQARRASPRSGWRVRAAQCHGIKALPQGTKPTGLDDSLDSDFNAYHAAVRASGRYTTPHRSPRPPSHPSPSARQNGLTLQNYRRGPRSSSAAPISQEFHPHSSVARRRKTQSADPWRGAASSSFHHSSHSRTGSRTPVRQGAHDLPTTSPSQPSRTRAAARRTPPVHSPPCDTSDSGDWACGPRELRFQSTARQFRCAAIPYAQRHSQRDTIPSSDGPPRLRRASIGTVQYSMSDASGKACRGARRGHPTETSVRDGPHSRPASPAPTARRWRPARRASVGTHFHPTAPGVRFSHSAGGRGDDPGQLPRGKASRGAMKGDSLKRRGMQRQHSAPPRMDERPSALPSEHLWYSPCKGGPATSGRTAGIRRAMTRSPLRHGHVNSLSRGAPISASVVRPQGSPRTSLPPGDVKTAEAVKRTKPHTKRIRRESRPLSGVSNQCCHPHAACCVAVGDEGVVCDVQLSRRECAAASTVQAHPTDQPLTLYDPLPSSTAEHSRYIAPATDFLDGPRPVRTTLTHPSSIQQHTPPPPRRLSVSHVETRSAPVKTFRDVNAASADGGESKVAFATEVFRSEVDKVRNTHLEAAALAHVHGGSTHPRGQSPSPPLHHCAPNLPPAPAPPPPPASSCAHTCVTASPARPAPSHSPPPCHNSPPPCRTIDVQRSCDPNGFVVAPSREPVGTTTRISFRSSGGGDGRRSTLEALVAEAGDVPPSELSDHNVGVGGEHAHTASPVAETFLRAATAAATVATANTQRALDEWDGGPTRQGTPAASDGRGGTPVQPSDNFTLDQIGGSGSLPRSRLAAEINAAAAIAADAVNALLSHSPQRGTSAFGGGIAVERIRAEDAEVRGASATCRAQSQATAAHSWCSNQRVRDIAADTLRRRGIASRHRTEARARSCVGARSAPSRSPPPRTHQRDLRGAGVPRMSSAAGHPLLHTAARVAHASRSASVMHPTPRDSRECRPLSRCSSRGGGRWAVQCESMLRDDTADAVPRAATAAELHPRFPFGGGLSARLASSDVVGTAHAEGDRVVLKPLPISARPAWKRQVGGCAWRSIGGDESVRAFSKYMCQLSYDGSFVSVYSHSRCRAARPSSTPTAPAHVRPSGHR